MGLPLSHDWLFPAGSVQQWLAAYRTHSALTFADPRQEAFCTSTTMTGHQPPNPALDTPGQDLLTVETCMHALHARYATASTYETMAVTINAMLPIVVTISPHTYTHTLLVLVGTGRRLHHVSRPACMSVARDVDSGKRRLSGKASISDLDSICHRQASLCTTRSCGGETNRIGPALPLPLPWPIHPSMAKH